MNRIVRQAVIISLIIINTLFPSIEPTISGNFNAGYILPLEKLKIFYKGSAKIRVFDSTGREYFQKQFRDSVEFKAGGALGDHSILIESDTGNLQKLKKFKVDCKTEIKDSKGIFSKLLSTLYWTMTGKRGEAQIDRYDGKYYHYFVRWLRDHVHVLKGMKYFYPELKSGIDLYTDSQREDGMIWDNYYPRNYEKNWWDKRFTYGDFIRHADNGRKEFHRIPIEADVEYLYIEGLYYTWKATGDDQWMINSLDNALKAIEYCTTDPYRWSEKYQLIKRGFTIDTWDFQPSQDAAKVDDDIMVVDLEKTKFGIMFGDNTGLAASCAYLAEMLYYSGRIEEAARVEKLGQDVQERIDDLAWNGNFYTHHIPEDPNVKRELGVDQSRQISLSNAYSINRNIRHEQAIEILESYLNIKENLPPGSPGEWYTIYPPFGISFGGHAKWQYMNGSVSPIVAGELAHGAFEHGYESYGVDILSRILELAEKRNDYLHCSYTGAFEENKNVKFTPLDLSVLFNAVYPPAEATHNGKWIVDDFDQTEENLSMFEHVPFKIYKPDQNNCLVLDRSENKEPARLTDLSARGKSFYLLHSADPFHFSGTMRLIYDDGTFSEEYLTSENTGNWWYGPAPAKYNKRKVSRVWRSNSPDQYAAFYLYGFNNPFPEKIISEIEFIANSEPGKRWNILGLTLSDSEVYFEPDLVSYGIPDNWGAAANVYALIEGLAGVNDSGVGFNNLSLSPRWIAAEENKAEVKIKYEASGGYAAYDYEFRDKIMRIIFTGSFDESSLSIFLPENNVVDAVILNGTDSDFGIKKIEDSEYLTISTDKIGVNILEIYFK